MMGRTGMTWLLAATVGMLALAGPAREATAQAPGEIAITDVDESNEPEIVLEVSVPASVTSGPVEPSSITLLENGAPIAAEVTPVPTDRIEIVLLIDTSGSMREAGAMDAAKLSAAGFLAELPSDVPVGIVAFADTPRLVSPLSTDRNLLNTALGGLEATGETALYDGIIFAKSLFSGGTTDKQFVLLSDGGDTVSRATLENAIEVTAEIRTSTIELVTSESNQLSLVELSGVGDGSLTSISDLGALGALYQEVANSLVNRYKLAFTATSSGSTVYAVNVASPDQLLTTSTTVLLPEAVAPPTTLSPTTTIATATIPAPAVAVASADVVALPPPPGDTNTSTGTPWVLLAVGAIAIFLAIIGLVLAVWPDGTRRIGRRQLGVDQKAKSTTPKQSVKERLSTLADNALEQRDQRGRLANALDVAAISMRPGEFLVLTTAAAFGAAVILLALVGPLGALIALAATPFVARSIISVRASRRCQAFDDQLPDVLQLIISALRSGHSLPQALDAVARQSAEPARTEFERIMFETRVGRDLSESLHATAERMQSKSFEWVVSALEINREVGGELAQVLSTVAETIRERQQLDRQVQTLTAEGRMSAYVLTALPLVMIAALALVNPGYFEPMKSAPGPAIIISSIMLLGVGWIWMQRLIKAEI
jgi:tight adherence protein B